MLKLKEYQRGALDALARWLETLEDTQRELETMSEMFRQAPKRRCRQLSLRHATDAASNEPTKRQRIPPFAKCYTFHQIIFFN